MVKNEIDLWVDKVTQTQSKNLKIIADALTKAGIILNESSEEDLAIWFKIEQYMTFSMGIAPYTQRQTPESRSAVEKMLEALIEFRGALSTVSELGKKDDDDVAKLNVAARLVHWAGLRFDAVDTVHGFDEMREQLYEFLEIIRGAGEEALRTGVSPKQGGNNRNEPYSIFAAHLRTIWNAKKPNDKGYYPSDGTFR